MINMLKQLKFLPLLGWLLLANISPVFAQTTLSAGDIAFTGYNADLPTTDFTFVLLKDINAGTVIYFTDRGWLSAGGFRANEGTLEWTATSSLSCGTVILVSDSSGGFASSIGSIQDTSTIPLDFSTGGDQILAYQGSSSNPTFIAGLNMDGTGWAANATNTNTSALPPGLINNVDALSISPEVDNAKYNCAVTSGSIATILAGINNSSNWTVNDAQQLALLPTCSFSCPVVVRDCNNVPNGTAFIDSCGVCAGGNTGIVPNPDSDSDGVLDCNDGCPNDINKTAPGQCGCGNADTDSDSDGTADCNDLCPNDINKTAPGQCGCGIADIDSDNDGTADCNDLCPSDPTKIAPGVCGCNNPDVDTDNDGVLNCNDGCPFDPNKLAPGACGCGRPDTDTDTDGTADCNDGCPNDALKTTPGACGCGVPEGTCFDCAGVLGGTAFVDSCNVCAGGNTGIVPNPDADNDGVTDCNDGCPNDPAKINPGTCGCGTPDTDADSDGTPNCNDLCPNDANKVAPGVCGCSVPDTDSDNDGTPNCNDQCPNDSNKTVPGSCGCGILDIDSDFDFTPDCNDQCPLDPNKITPGICGCGQPDFPIAQAGPDDTVCAAYLTNLTATGGVSYIWSTGDTGNVIAVYPLVNTTYTVSVTNLNGCVTTDSIRIDILPSPQVDLGNDTAICIGSSLALNGTGMGTYLWSTGSTAQSITVSPGLDTQYRLDVTGSNGCIGRDTIDVTVNPLPIAVAGRDTAICRSDSVLLQGSGGNTYQWSNGSSDSTITVAPANTSQFSLVVTDSNGCKDVDTVSIVVNPLPVANAGNNRDICFGDNITLTASGGFIYNWTTGENTASINVSPASTSIFEVVVTDANNCSDSDQVNVTVNPLPLVAIVDLDTLYCAIDGDFPVSLQGSPTGGLFSGTGVTGNSLNYTEPGGFVVEISYTYIDSNGCSAIATDSTFIDICESVAEIGSIQSIAIQPNPFDDVLSIQMDAIANDKIIVKLTDLMGRQILIREYLLSIGSNYFSIDGLQELGSGTYLLNIQNGSAQKAYRLLKLQ
ncbi:MAG: T9SS type A sorting domain-containing protein [Chitinophagales bacterium]|nr:T9SS type A sorting domain-containing protein [Chitinophagales bacterium]